MRLLFAALTTVLLLNATAMACPGQTGKVIFEDTFTDDSGGWQLGAPDAEIKDGALLMRPDARGLKETGGPSSQSVVQTFSATDGDYCMEFVLPKPIAADNDIMAGLLFWVTSAKEKYMWYIWTDGSASLSKQSAGTWTAIFTQSTDKLEPDKITSMRVVVKGGKLTLFVNGKQVKAIRAQTPTGDLHFGVFAQVQKLSEANPVVQFKSFKVTTGD